MLRDLGENSKSSLDVNRETLELQAKDWEALLPDKNSSQQITLRASCVPARVLGMGVWRGGPCPARAHCVPGKQGMDTNDLNPRGNGAAALIEV